MRIGIVVVVALSALALGVSAPAAALQVDGRCFGEYPQPSTQAIVRGVVGLTPEQTEEVRFRLSQWGTGRYQGLGGLGLTAAQKNEINRRLDAIDRQSRHPIGYPCPPFKNATRVAKFVRAELIANGFRPRMRVWVAAPRQLQFEAIQDGVLMHGMVVKIAPRRIAIHLNSVNPPYFEDGASYTLGFEA